MKPDGVFLFGYGFKYTINHFAVLDNKFISIYNCEVKGA